jgi:hypothetical protein
VVYSYLPVKDAIVSCGGGGGGLGENRGDATTGNSVVRVYLEGKTALHPKNLLGEENRELNLLDASK